MLFILHFDNVEGRQTRQQLFVDISNVLFCLIRSAWVTNNQSIAINSWKLRFHFSLEKWLSLGHLLRKKNPKSWKHVFYTNWTILSRKKIFSEKVEKKFFLDHSVSFTKSGIFPEPHLRICSFFQGW